MGTISGQNYSSCGVDYAHFICFLKKMSQILDFLNQALSSPKVYKICIPYTSGTVGNFNLID